MASIFYDTTGSFSALSPKKVIAGAYNPTITVFAWDALNTTRYIAFTPSEALDMEGAMLCLHNESTVGADTVTCALQEDSGGGFADVAGATKTLTVTEVAGAHTGMLRMSPGWVYFKFGTAATVTTDANRWRLKISSAGVYASSICIYQTYGYACVATATTTYSSGDNVIVDGGVIVTQDQSVTATNLIGGVNAHWLVPSTVAAAYTLTITNFWISKNFRLCCGEDDTHRIPYANKFTLAVTNWKHGDGYPGGQGFEFEFWGEKPTDYYTFIASDVAASQKVVVTSSDMSAAWVSTDVLTVAGRSSGTNGYEQMTIDTISGTSVTCTVNFAEIHYSGWFIVNNTRASKCGIELNGSGISGYNYTNFAVVNLSGVYLSGTNVLYYFASSYESDPAVFSHRHIDMVFSNTGATLSVLDAGTGLAGTTLTGGIYQYVFLRDGGASAGMFNIGGVLGNVTNCAVNNIYLTNNSTCYTIAFSLTATDCSSISNIQTCGCYSGYTSSSISLTNSTITNLKIMGGAYGTQLSSVASVIDTGSIDYSTTYGCYIATNTIDTKFKDFDFGQDYANTTNDIYIPTGIVAQLILENCKPSSGNKEVGNIANSPIVSFAKWDTYSGTTNDHRSWWKYGYILSTGSGLSDTTVHTAGSGKFAMKLTPSDSTGANLFDSFEFTVPTGNIQNKTMTVAVWVKLNNAAYYAGTHQLPRLTIDYDNGTTAYAQAAQSTSWQQLFVTFTPTTAYGQITVTISGKTDATTTNRDFYVDDFSVLYPSSVALDLGGLDLWADALPVSPPIAIPISAYTVSNAVWEELISSHTTAATLGKHLGKKLLTSNKFVGLK